MESGGRRLQTVGLEDLPSEMEVWLGARGVHHTTVDSLDALADKIANGGCDLVIIPGAMPELIARIRIASGKDEFLPIVANSRDPAIRTAALHAGADAAVSNTTEECAAQILALMRVRERSLDVADAKRQLEMLSITDDLTGLHNKRWLLGRLAEEVSRLERYKDGVALVLFDLDHFKRINDAHGHLFGDEVLKSFANLLMRTFRGVDRTARYGGEEFAVILPETTLKGAMDAAERFRVKVEKERPAGVAVTTSAGVAAYGFPGQGSAEDLLRQADVALYRAKREGRNRVLSVESDDEMDTSPPQVAIPR